MRDDSKLRVLRNRNYRLYFAGQLVSQTGTWMQVVAEGWLVLQLSGSVAALGVVNFAFAVPSLALTLMGGAVADRGDRRRIAVVTQVAMMLTALAMGVLIALNRVTVWAIGAAAVAAGAAMAYDLPARQALVPQMVDPEDLPQAMAFNQIAFNGSRLLGPALASVTIHAFGLASAYFANALSFVAVVTSLMLIRLPPRVVAARPPGSTTAAVREGLAYVWSSRLLRSLVLAMSLTTLLVFPALAILSPAYVHVVLHRGPGTVGLLMAVSGGSAMLGAVALMWVPAKRRGHAMAVCVVVLGAALGVLASARSVLPAAIGTGLLATAFSVSVGLSMITIQTTVPDELRGRVSSVTGLTFSGVMPFSGLGMSFVVDRLGFERVYTANAALYVAVGLAILLPSGMIGYVPPLRPARGDAPG